MCAESKVLSWDGVRKNSMYLLLLLSAAIAASAYAESRKDVSDPVLQELIASYGTKMPRFIDKHGTDIFVADEPVTRGSLLYALYEYEKWMKSSRKESVSRQEVEDVQAKISLLERKLNDEFNRKFTAAELTNLLQPSMGTILDNNLEKSKIFSEFKNGVESRQKSAEVSLEMMARTKAEMGDVIRRVSVLEKTRGGGQGSGDVASKQDLQELRNKLTQLETSISDARGAAAPANDEVKNTVAQLQRDTANIARRLDGVESAKGAGQPAVTLDMLANTKAEMGELSRRVAAIEKAPKGAAAAPANDEVKNTVAQLQRDTANIARRLDGVESAKGAGQPAVTLDMMANTKAEMGELSRRVAAVEKAPKSAPAADGASKQEVQELRNKVAQLERALADARANSNDELKNTVAQLQRDMANMSRRIEDNSKTSSDQSGVSLEMMAGTKSDIGELMRRVASLEKNSRSAASGGDVTLDMLAGTKAEMGELIRRVSTLEKSLKK